MLPPSPFHPPSQFRSLFLVGAMGALLGCQVTETSAGSPDASVSVDATVLERAVAVAREASAYISFAYSHDGCHDRSIMISAELAAAGIPSNAQFIVTGEANLTPRQHPDVTWNYHVAPVIYLPEFGPPPEEIKILHFTNGVIEGAVPAGAYIVDPSLYPDEIVAPLSTWVEDMSSQGQSGFMATYDARDALNKPNDEEKARRDMAGVLPLTIDQMPRHWQFQLGSACSFLSRDAKNLESEVGAEGVAQIRQRMNSGARALLIDMLAKDRLLEREPVPEFPCWSP